MDPVTLIVTALAAGAASALQDDAKSAVKVAFARLRQLVKKRFKDLANGEYLLEKHAAAPEVWQEPLKAELTEARAADDEDVITAAQELMRILDSRGTAAGKYNVINVQGSPGVQIGDGNTQVNNYGPSKHVNVSAGRDAYSDRDIFKF
jgi:hypothetical protein